MVLKLFLFLIFLSFNGSSMEEEKQDLENPAVLKQTIQGQIEALRSNLENQFKELGEQKGWFQQLQELNQNIDPSKKRVLKNIQDHFLKIKKYDFVDLAFKPLEALEKLPDILITSKIKEYFGNTYNVPFEAIKVSEKKAGVQFGKIVEILNNQKILVRYYVKTHARGLLKETKNSTSKPVDPIELFTYKFLEHSGYGSESHFFYDDERNFYIATKDISSYAAKPEAGYVQSYEDFLEKDKSKIKDEYAHFYSDNKLSNPIINGLFDCDIISRIIRLSDLHTNEGNMIFIKTKGTYGDDWQLKILDFRNREENYYPTGKELFGGLVQGNGQFYYLGQNDKVMVKYLGEKNLPLRINYAKDFNYKNILTALEKAKNSIMDYAIKNQGIFEIAQEKIEKHYKALIDITNEFAFAAQDYSF